ncbi:MAG TPA: alpha/beta hydrolase [Tepidisphaeraceae bacterium]|nr:alpha/beta hydrolase [Tepidisphaeraceae bacterium]
MRRALIFMTLFLAVGCAAQPPDEGKVIFIVPGVGGNLGELKAGLSEKANVQVVSWGAPLPLFFANFSTKWIHDSAEKKLAQLITQWHEAHPQDQIDLVGHSAGCGVILGALPKISAVHVERVVLLAPSVSPSYDLHPAIQKVDRQLHAFYSEQDTVFLKWRDSHFGTYDRVKTPAAGYAGFAGNYPADKVVQHRYDDRWRELGNNGGHFGTLSDRFVHEVVAPLLVN